MAGGEDWLMMVESLGHFLDLLMLNTVLDLLMIDFMDDVADARFVMILDFVVCSRQ